MPDDEARRPTRNLVLPPWGTAALALILATLACTVSRPPLERAPLATAVAATLTAQPTSSAIPPTAPPSLTPEPTPAPTATAVPSPPPDAVSLNCDGTYQRLRLLDGGAAGRSLRLDRWEGGWHEVWSLEGGDPMIRQLASEAGLYAFGGCRQLIVAPLRYAGSGAVLELHVLAWTGGKVVEVYQNDGIGGDWRRDGDRLVFEKSLYLYNEPNCCPCNRQVTVHRWNGSAFLEEETEIRPTYSGTPPPICQP